MSTNQSESIPCDICAALFQSKNALKDHKRKMHQHDVTCTFKNGMIC